MYSCSAFLSEYILYNQETVKKLIKDLQTVPEGLDKCYDTVSDLYDAYNTLTELAVNPSGNYSGYSSNKSTAVSDFMSAYEKLDNQIPINPMTIIKVIMIAKPIIIVVITFLLCFFLVLAIICLVISKGQPHLGHIFAFC